MKKKNKKLTAFGFVRIVKQSFGDNMLFSDELEGVLNFIAMSLRLRADSIEVRDTCIADSYINAANAIHVELDKRGYYDE